jgi:hypothetical protein
VGIIPVECPNSRGQPHVNPGHSRDMPSFFLIAYITPLQVLPLRPLVAVLH